MTASTKRWPTSGHRFTMESIRCHSMPTISSTTTIHNKKGRCYPFDIMWRLFLQAFNWMGHNLINDPRILFIFLIFFDKITGSSRIDRTKVNRELILSIPLNPVILSFLLCRVHPVIRYKKSSSSVLLQHSPMAFIFHDNQLYALISNERNYYEKMALSRSSCATFCPV
jgi:hypothetical protein